MANRGALMAEFTQEEKSAMREALKEAQNR